MTKMFPLVSIITVNYNGKHLLKDCLNSLLALNYPQDRVEIFMVDNGSTDGSIEYVQKYFPKVNIIKNDINNYCRANNLGIKQVKGEYIALVNNDVKVDRDWLIELINVAKSDKRIGAVTSKILFFDNRINSTGHIEFPNFYWGDRGFKEEDKGQYDKIEEIDSLSHCACLYSKSCFEEVGLLDEDFNIYLEDVDMSIRAKQKGWKLFFCPKSICYHRFHSSIEENLVDFYCERNRLLLIAKHYPEKLAEALFGKGYFTFTSDFSQRKDIYDILPSVFSKLFKHHNSQRLDELLPDIWKSLKKILNLEKHLLIQRLDIERQTIKQKDSQLYNLFQESQQRLEEIKQRDIQLQERDKQLSDLTIQLHRLIKESQEQLEEIKRKEAILEEIIKEKDAQISQRDKTIEEIIKDIKEKEVQLQEKDKKIIGLYNEISQIYNSQTYRYFAMPIWKVLDIIKSILRILGFHWQSTNIKKILIIKPHCVSMEETENALQYIRSNNLEAKITLLADFPETEFNRFIQSKYIDEKKSYIGKKLFNLRLIKLLINLRSEGFDEAIVIIGKPTYHGYRKSKLFAIFSNARQKEVYFTDAKTRTPLKVFSRDIKLGISNQISFWLRGIFYSFWSSLLLWLIIGLFLIFIVLPMKIRKLFQR